MDTRIFLKILASRINHEYFLLKGTDVYWTDEKYNTPENQSIVADVIANYDTLKIEILKQDKLADLADYRFAKETAGITISNAIIRTDLESQAMINGAVAYVTLNPTALIDWKADGSWVQIDKDTVIAIGNAVGAHVQACYSRERTHAEAIAALTTPEEIAAYDFTTGWPE